MTYIDRLNAFYRGLETNSLAGASQLLYLHLLDIFNRCGWPEWVQVDNRRMLVGMRMSDEKTLIRARERLIAAGLIEYQKGKKGSPGRYALTEYTGVYTGEMPVQMPVKTPVKVPVKVPVKTPVQTPAIIRQKTKTKTKTNPPTPLPEGWGEALTRAVEEWLVYKQEKGQGYRPQGLASLVAQIQSNAERFGEAAVAELIHRCMACNWQGIIFDRLEAGPAKSGGKPVCSDYGTPGAKTEMRKQMDELDRIMRGEKT